MGEDVKRIFLAVFFYIIHTSLFAKTVLVTGGAGFIGSHVAQSLLTRGDTVIIIDNLNDSCDVRIKKKKS